MAIARSSEGASQLNTEPTACIALSFIGGDNYRGQQKRAANNL